MENKVLKRSLSLLAVFLVFVSIVFSFWSKNSLSASAESASTSSEETESGLGIDLSQYPMANLIPYPYVGVRDGETGINWIANPDGTIVANGTAEIHSYYYFITRTPFALEDNCTYRISGIPDGYVSVNQGVSFQVEIYDSKGLAAYPKVYSDGYTFTTTTAMYIDVFRIYIKAGTTVENLVFSPMITKGETVYPYMPSFDLLYANVYDKIYDSAYDEGYDSGLTDGEESGYESGFLDGYSGGLEFSFGRQGLINPNTVDSVVTWGTASDGSGALKSDISSYFLSYDNYTQDISTGLSLLDTSFGECYPEYKSFSSVVISFKKTFNLRDLNLLLRSGSDDCPTYIGSLYFSVGFPNSGTEVLTVKTNVTDYVDFYEGGFYSINSSLSKTDFYFDHVQIMINHWGQPDNDVLMSCLAGSPLLNFYVSNELLADEVLKAEYDKGYAAGVDIGVKDGYKVGYNKGVETGTGNGYNDGYEVGKVVGYDEGKVVGYDEGYENGVAVGKIEGKKEGYAAGIASADSTDLGQSIESFIFALFDAPINSFMSVFNFEVLGFDVGGLVSFIFTMLVIVFVYRMVT